eukprot:c26283_g1_i1.p1 GENE.c26283_g1_i1~~c26283_g1_i1.p1  ORF type:complete len:330 (+),score=79.98 c26283_g1_i1:2-991(+)
MDGKKEEPKNTGPCELPFVEKYRPTVLADITGNEDAVARLQVIAEDGNMPNLILTGPPGVGKTTSILCLARELLGNNKDAILELNASDDRGIDVVRNKIKMFAQKKVTLPEGRHKIIILDEADSMVEGAQQALRRTMEMYSSSTRFALAANQSSKIIEPIQSRCAILRYSKLTDAQLLQRLIQVIEAEHISYTQGGLEAIVFTSDGDMRQALNNLQSTASGFGHVTEENVFKVCDQPHPQKIKAMLRACAKGDLEVGLGHMRELWGQGYDSSDIIGTMFRVVKYSDDIPEDRKLIFIKEIGLTHMRIVEGAGTFVQLTSLLGRLCLVSL